MSAATIEHFAAARVGDSLGVHAWITGNYEHKGHLILDHSTRRRWPTMSGRATGRAYLDLPPKAARGGVKNERI
jgi:hypothetical protein